MNYKAKQQLFSNLFLRNSKNRVFIPGVLFGILKIINIIKRARSTIKRELDRNTIHGKYSTKNAQALYSKLLITKLLPNIKIMKLYIRNYQNYFKIFW